MKMALRVRINHSLWIKVEKNQTLSVRIQNERTLKKIQKEDLCQLGFAELVYPYY